jgi:hypothetical protein
VNESQILINLNVSQCGFSSDCPRWTV